MGRRIGAAALVVVVAALAVRWISAPRDGMPLDPHGTGPQGLGALVETLERLDADVTVDNAPPTGADVVLLLRDQLDADARDRLRDWVRDGGRLVVTDPGSELTPTPVGPIVAFGTPTLAPGCDLAALDDVGALEPPSAIGYDRDELPGDATACFGDDDAVWLTATPTGDGVIVALGSEQPWVNRHLGDVDHAVLAMALLAPRADTTVGLTEVGRPSAADTDVTDVIADSVWWGLAQLAVAGALVLAWRFPRDAPVVTDPPAVALPGSELVLATADLRQQRHGHERAGASLRAAARAHARARLAAPPDTTDETLARLAHERAGVDVGVARRALAARPRDDGDLVAHGAAVAHLRAALDHPRPPAAARADAHADREQERA